MAANTDLISGAYVTNRAVTSCGGISSLASESRDRCEDGTGAALESCEMRGATANTESEPEGADVDEAIAITLLESNEGDGIVSTTLLTSCDVCEANAISTSDYFCTVCKISLCTEHRQDHDTSMARYKQRGHVVISMDEHQRSQTSRSMCSTHIDQEIDTVCSTCYTFYCSLCIETGDQQDLTCNATNQRHMTTGLEDLHENICDDLQSYQRQLELQADEFSHRIEECELESREAEDKCALMTAELERATQRHINEIKEKLTLTLNDINAHRNLCVSMASGRIRDIGQIQETVRTVQQSLREMLDNQSMNVVINAYRGLHDNIIQVLNVTFDELDLPVRNLKRRAPPPTAELPFYVVEASAATGPSAVPPSERRTGASFTSFGHCRSSRAVAGPAFSSSGPSAPTDEGPPPAYGDLPSYLQLAGSNSTSYNSIRAVNQATLRPLMPAAPSISRIRASAPPLSGFTSNRIGASAPSHSGSTPNLSSTASVPYSDHSTDGCSDLVSSLPMDCVELCFVRENAVSSYIYSVMWADNLAPSSERALLLATNTGIEVRSGIRLTPLVTSSFGDFVDATIFRGEVLALKRGFKILNGEVYSKILRSRKTLLHDINPCGPLCFSNTGETVFVIKSHQLQLKVYTVQPFTVKTAYFSSEMTTPTLIHSVDNETVLLADESSGEMVMARILRSLYTVEIRAHWSGLNGISALCCSDDDESVIYAIIKDEGGSKLVVLSIEGGDIQREYKNDVLSRTNQVTGMSVRGRLLALACGSNGLALYVLPQSQVAE